MKKLFFIFILAVLVLSCTRAQQPPVQSVHPAAAELTFSFTRQSGSASNQYAVWIEDAQGQHIKTLYAARWTANGGFSRRPTSIPMWVQRSGLAEMSREQVDVVSGATPRTGSLTYVWDGTNSLGVLVPAGDYVLVLEGTLRWENQVYYRAPIRLGQGEAIAQVIVEYTTSDRDTTAERSMISDVIVKVLR